jgi:transcriptional regulator with XRE-family HTH domain
MNDQLTISGDGIYNPDMLKMAIHLRGMSGAALAKTIGVQPRMVYAYLGGREPEADAMKRIVDALELPRHFFYRAGEYRERDERYPLDMFVMKPLRPPPTRADIIALIADVPDSELPTLHAYLHEVVRYADNVTRLEAAE